MFLLLLLHLHLQFQLLVHLGISTLAAASDLNFRIALYVLLKLVVIPGLCTVVDAQQLDESALIRLTHYHSKPLQPSLMRSSRLKSLGNPRKAGGKPAAIVLGGMRWCDTVAYYNNIS